MNSQTVSFYTLVSAIKKASDTIGGNPSAVNDYQGRFLSDFYHPSDVDLMPEISSWVSENVKELNDILSSNGFDIQLDPFSDNSFGVVSILNLILQWKKEGEKISIKGDNARLYNGVKLDRNIMFYHSTESYYPIVCIDTRNGDKLYMVVAEKPFIRFSLMDKVSSIVKHIDYEDYSYCAVKFPVVDYDQKIDLSWVLGLQFITIHKIWWIEQALQQTRFALDEKGARIKDAVALEMRCAMGAPYTPHKVDLVIDKPFYLLVQREGLHMPLFVGYFSYDSWKQSK